MISKWMIYACGVWRNGYHIIQMQSGCISCLRSKYIISRSDISLTNACSFYILSFEVILLSDNKLVDLSFELAKSVVCLVDNIKTPKSSYMLDQLARAGTSVGANIHEAQYAHSKADFVAKLEIALKEANETSYWLKLLKETGRISEAEHQSTEKLCGNIRRLLIASCSTAKANLSSNKNQNTEDNYAD